MDLAARLIQDYDKHRTDRQPWESQWQDIIELVRPNGKDINRQSVPGEQRTRRIYDGTAPWAAEQLAAGLQSYLSSPVDRWFNIVTADRNYMLDWEMRTWLEDVSDTMYHVYSLPEVGFSMHAHEVYQDLVNLGTGCVYQDRPNGRRYPRFRSFPLSDIFINEDDNGNTNTLYRNVEWSTMQVIDVFGKNAPEKIKKAYADGKLRQTWKFFHCVMPRTHMKALQYGGFAKSKPYGSYWMCLDSKSIVEEGGYDEFPYHVPRWTKIAGEKYGRSPAMTCLPDILMVNEMSKTIIKAAQKAVDPPIMVPDDGFLMPLRTHPGAVLFYTPGTDKIEVLESNSKFNVSQELMAQRHEHILRAFYVDWMRMQKNTVEMTAYEVADRREEQLRLMAPMLGRVQTEMLSPIIKRTYNLLAQAGMLPPPPVDMSQIKLDIEYVSPASMAQFGAKALSAQRYVQDLIPFAQVDPQIMDIIDTDAFAQYMAEIRDVSRKILRKPEDVAKRRENRAEMQNMQQMTEIGVQASQAIKNLGSVMPMGNQGQRSAQ